MKPEGQAGPKVSLLRPQHKYLHNMEVRMIRYRPTTCDRRFTTITVSVDALDKLMCADDGASYIRAGGIPAQDIPWQVQALHVSRYYDRLAEVTVEEVANRPVVRLSDHDERQEGAAAVIVVDGCESIAALRDAGVRTVDVEVPWWQREEVEARLINMDV